MTIAPARLAAFEVIRRVFEEEAYADRALRSASERLDDRDRSLARQLAFGTVQRVRTLDHAIETLGKRPVRKLDPPVLAAQDDPAPPPIHRHSSWFPDPQTRPHADDLVRLLVAPPPTVG